MNERRVRSKRGSDCNRYRRIKVYITHLGSMDIVFLEIEQEAHLVKYPRYEAQHHFMLPWPRLWAS